MSRLKKESNNVTLVINETLEDFFARGKETARLLDKKKVAEKRRIISFEDPIDLAKFLMHTKMKLISDIRKKPRSITNLAKDLKRSRAAVCKDIQELESVGIVRSEYAVNPGHGRCKIIMAVDKEPVYLQVNALL